jgi:glycosyltransferase involved in cell wall biosynthesis
MLNNTPLVSIITASYNSVNTIEQTIKSVISQSYSNIEYIIIDGGSTDGTLDIINKYNSNIKFWVSEKDKGIYDAWNKGLKIAKGDWISFLGSDDLYIHNGIELFMDYINTHPENKYLDFVSSKIEYVDKDLKLLKIIGEKWSWPKFSYYMNTDHCGMLHSKLFFNKYGNFDDSYKITGDYALLLKPGKNLKAGFINEITVKMRSGGISKNGLKVFNETFRAKFDSKNVSLLSCVVRYIIGVGMFFLRKTLFLLKKNKINFL